MISKDTNKIPYLSKRNHKILSLWNSGNHTYESIGDIFFLSRERIRQILSKIKNKGFEVTDTKTISKSRTLNKLEAIAKTINHKDFAEKYHNGFTRAEFIDYFDIDASVYNYLIDKLTEKKIISHKIKVLNDIKYDIENISEIQKFRENIIIKMRAENLSYQDIQDELQISKPRLAQIIKVMKDRGINIPNSRSTGLSLSTEKTIERVNNIDKCLDEGMNMRQISMILGIGESTIKKLIYRHLIDK
jgi:DNA-binding CsgD family transcriptional regulator